MGIWILALVACGEELLSYKCTCTQVAFYENGDIAFEDDFSLNICETEETMNAAFEPEGIMSTETLACEERLDVDYDGASCECDCEYLGLCQG